MQKNGITIFELKKSETTLEDAFINLIDRQKVPQEETKEDKKKVKEEKKAKKAQEKEAKKDKVQKEKVKKEKKEKGGDK